MAKLKALESNATAQLALLRKFAGNDPEKLKEVERMEKELNEAMGERKTIGPCEGCGATKTVAPAQYDYQKSRWFTCPHGDDFCPDCLNADRKEAIAKMKEKREERSKDAKKTGKKK